MLASLVRTLKNLVDYIRGVGDRLAGLAGGTAPAGHRPDAGLREWFAGLFAEDVRKNFEQSRSPQGDPWRPLKYRVGKPLILTGRLMRAAVEAAGRAQVNPGAGLVRFRAEMVEPSYWAVHEFGTRTVPARPYFGPRPETLEALAERSVAELAKVVEGKS